MDRHEEDLLLQHYGFRKSSYFNETNWYLRNGRMYSYKAAVEFVLSLQCLMTSIHQPFTTERDCRITDPFTDLGGEG